MKPTWRVINDTLGKRNQKTNLPISIEHNNTLITDPNKIANTFNDYFVNIGTNLVENVNMVTMKCINNIFRHNRNVVAHLRK